MHHHRTAPDLDQLIEEAMKIGQFKTKRETLATALRDYIDRRNRLKIIDLFGTIEYDENYNYKAERQRERG